jgi:transposase
LSLSAMSNLYWLSEEQMVRLRPFFPKSRGVPRVDDRRVLIGIIFINLNDLRWFGAPKEYGLAKTLYNRWKR